MNMTPETWPDPPATPSQPTAQRSVLSRLFVLLLAAVTCVGLGWLVGRGLKSATAVPLAAEVVRPERPDLGLLLPAVVVLGWLVIAVHELGHALAARLQGMNVMLYTAGPLRLQRIQGRLRVQFNTNLMLWGGLVMALPNAHHDFQRQMFWMVLGGPLASAVLSLVALLGWLLLPAGGVLSPLLLTTALLSAGIFLVTAIPAHTGGFETDGRQLLRMARKDPIFARRAVWTQRLAAAVAGARPRTLPLPELDPNANPIERCAVELMAYHQELDRGDRSAARTRLHALMASYSEQPALLKPQIAVEACCFLASAGHEADRARIQSWAAHARGGMLESHDRWRVRAATAWAHGETQELSTALQRAHQALPSAMDQGHAQVVAEWIERMRVRKRDLAV